MAGLRKVSFIVSVSGIFLLLLLSNLNFEKTILIKEVSKSDIGSRVKVAGTINALRSYPDIQVFTLKDSTGTMNIISEGLLGLKKGDKVTVLGVVESYKEYLQIRADSISLD